MTVVLSAMGTRIDCDRCDAHVASSWLSIEALRRTNGYQLRDGSDYCRACTRRSAKPPDDGRTVKT